MDSEYTWNRKEDPVWWGWFALDPIDGELECYPRFGQHITFGWKVPAALFEDRVPWGDIIPVEIIGYANDGLNEGFLCTLPDEIDCLYHHEHVPPHITISYDSESSPNRTGYMEFMKLDEPYTLLGRFGMFKDHHVIF